MRKRKQLSGGAKMKAAGKKAILLGVSPEQLGALRRAADIELRPVTQFVVYYAMQAAERLIEEQLSNREKPRRTAQSG